MKPVADQAVKVKTMVADREAAVQMIEDADGDEDIIAMAEEEIAMIDVKCQMQRVSFSFFCCQKIKTMPEMRFWKSEPALVVTKLRCLQLIPLEYQRLAAKQGWRFEVMEVSEIGIGGYKEATANISGSDVFARLKFNQECIVFNVFLKQKQAGVSIHPLPL